MVNRYKNEYSALPNPPDSAAHSSGEQKANMLGFFWWLSERAQLR